MSADAPSPPRPLFAYGTLLDPGFVERLLERPVEAVDAELLDFEIVRIEGAPYPTLFAAEGETVPGRLYRGLTAADYARLDAYEGVGEGLYARVDGRARIAAGAAVEVHVYIATERGLRRLGALDQDPVPGF